MDLENFVKYILEVKYHNHYYYYYYTMLIISIIFDILASRYIYNWFVNLYKILWFNAYKPSNFQYFSLPLDWKIPYILIFAVYLWTAFEDTCVLSDKYHSLNIYRTIREFLQQWKTLWTVSDRCCNISILHMKRFYL